MGVLEGSGFAFQRNIIKKNCAIYADQDDRDGRSGRRHCQVCRVGWPGSRAYTDFRECPRSGHLESGKTVPAEFTSGTKRKFVSDSPGHGDGLAGLAL